MSIKQRIKDYDIPRIYAAQKLIDDNLKTHFKITELAQKVGLNECKLKYGFKTILNKGVHEYRLSKRLKYAKYLLENTEKTISEIGYIVGFDSREGFSNAFKREFKQSPKFWRTEADLQR